MKNTMNIILLAIGILTVAFTITMIWLYMLTGGIPDTLVSMWFTYVLGECGCMGVIKSVKVIAENRLLEKEKSENRKAEDLSKMSREEAGK